MNKFGQNLKNIRQSVGLSQFQLAKLVNTTQQRVSEWEKGQIEPSLRYLIKLVNVLEVSFEELTEGVLSDANGK